MSTRGKLIVFEGLDRAGKSTQCEKLVESLNLQNLKVWHMKFPDRDTAIGKIIDAYLRGEWQCEDHVIHLLFSANRWEKCGDIRTALDCGMNVVVDRYYYSGAVYSAAKQNPTLTLAWARKPDEGLPRPDVCIFLDISPEDAAKRGGYGAEKYEKQEMQKRVRELFDVMQASADKDDFVVINGGDSIEAVAKAINQVVDKMMHRVDEEHLPLRFVQPW